MENGNGNTLPANVVSMAAALAQSAGMAGAAGGNELFARFTKFGEWVYGADGTEVEEGSIWAVNPNGFQHGFIAWDQDNTSGGPTGEVLVPATQPMPLEEELPAVSGSWSKCVGVQLRCTTGEDEGVQIVWKGNSHGARKAYAGLLQELIAQIGKDPENPVALVSLGADSYVHKQYGKIFSPVIDVVGWASMDGDPADEVPKAINKKEPAEEPAAEEKPRRRRRKSS